MIRALFLLLFPMSAIAQAPSYHTDKTLEARLKALTDTFHGVAGVYVLNLKTNKEAAINAPDRFPS